MPTLTTAAPLIGGGDMDSDVNVGIQPAGPESDGYLTQTDWNRFDQKSGGGTTLADYGITDAQPLDPDLTFLANATPGPSMVYGTNATGVRGFYAASGASLGYTPEDSANKVTGFSSPTDTQYPSALLVQTALNGKVSKLTDIVAGTHTKISYNEQGLVTGGADATTADIAESLDKRYVTDNQRTALGNLSGVNTGDQDLSGFALQTDLDNLSGVVDGISSSLGNYATTAALALTNADVATINSQLPNYATNIALSATNDNVTALANDLSSNYTPLDTHNALANEFAILQGNLADPAFVDSTAFEAKLTFSHGLTRAGNEVTNDSYNVVRPAHTFLGNNGTIDGIPTFVRPAAADLNDGTTGTGKVVMDNGATLINPTLTAPLLALLTDAGVSTAPSVVIVEHDFAGGGAILAGYGATLEFRGRSTTTSHRTQGAIRTVWLDPTDGSRQANMIFSPVRGSVATDALWLHADGSMALGANNGSGLGVLYAHGGFQTQGVGVGGQVLRDNGSAFVASRLDVGDLLGQFASCSAARSTTVDQTAATEQTHLTIPVNIVNPLAIGTTWRIVAWGNMDNGSTSTTYTATLRWGGLTGVILLTFNFASANASQTNRSWRVEFDVVLTATGVSGAARCCVLAHERVTINAGDVTVFQTDSGATDITGINATANTNMVLTWNMNSTVGAPHVRTFGGFGELVRRSPDAPAST